MGAQYILSRVITSNKILQVLQYECQTESLTVAPKHVKLPTQKEDIKGIVGLEAIKKPFEFVKIQESIDINGIGSIAYHQARR